MPLDPQDQPPPYVVTPQPVPFTPAYGVVTADEGINLGVIEFYMLTGKTVLMTDSATIRRIASEFSQLADKVDSTPIAVRNVPPGLLGPGGQPL